MNNGMQNYLVELTETDRAILSSYCTLCDCLALYLGGGYEIVVHSLGVDDNFIIKIANGSHSSRSEGDPISGNPAIVVERLYIMLRRKERPVTVYFNEGKGGVVFKTATIGIVGSYDRLIGMFCLNFSLNTPLMDIVELFSLPGDVVKRKAGLSNYEEKSYESVVADIVRKISQEIMENPDIPSKYKKKEIIRKLCDEGVFKIKNSVSVCAEILGINITTVYMHIRSFEDS